MKLNDDAVVGAAEVEIDEAISVSSVGEGSDDDEDVDFDDFTGKVMSL